MGSSRRGTRTGHARSHHIAPEARGDSTPSPGQDTTTVVMQAAVPASLHRYVLVEGKLMIRNPTQAHGLVQYFSKNTQDFQLARSVLLDYCNSGWNIPLDSLAVSRALTL
jgi:hypothetical protein